MKKLLLILPIVFGAISALPAHADGDIDDFLLGKDRGRPGQQCYQQDANGTKRICYRNTSSGGNAQRCGSNATENQECESTGTSVARCQSNGSDHLTCTAKICQKGYYLWVTSARIKKTPYTYADYESQGVCIPENWCESKDCPTCTLHTFEWVHKNYKNTKMIVTDEICYEKEITEPQSNDTDEDDDESEEEEEEEEEETEETFTCELQFDDSTTITNVAVAESIKPNSAHSVQLWKLDANRDNPQSAYADENNSTYKQNYSSSANGYDADTPHLFNLKGITRISSKGTSTYYSTNNIQQLKDALYVKFTCKECDKGQCFEFDNVATIPTLPSVTFKCTSRTQCSELDVFTELDKYLNMEYFTQEPSVWINAQGKFNTARLASDSIAGVVLGTVGGIVTSKIIKKNQIKNGFEDLKCTIGGQDVATYGDEFTVGVK